METKENIVWNSKIIRHILIHLNKKGTDYPSNVTRKTKFVYCSVLPNFKVLREAGLIEPTEKKGRRTYPKKYPSKRNKYYRLTDKGKMVTELLLKIDEEMK